MASKKTNRTYLTIVILLILCACIVFICHSGIRTNKISPISYIQPTSDERDAEYYRRIQDEFLENIARSQSNCTNDRVLLFEIFGDGFANIHHYIGHALLIALASNRRLHIYGNFKYFGGCNEFSSSNNWHCIYNALNTCALINEQRIRRRQLRDRGISLRSQKQHKLFDHYFGKSTFVQYMIEKFVWSNGIFDQHWFHKFDALFVRSHVQYFIWSTMKNHTLSIINSNPMIKHVKALKQKGEKYISFHIRKTDNVEKVRKDFGIDADKVFSMSNYMKMVEEYVDVNGVSTIFVCTDNSEIIESIRSDYDGKSKFNFLYNENAKRNVTSEWIWFLDDIQQSDLWNIIIDVEMMRFSDYLIGSATSNVYRLGMELNYVENWAKNQIVDEQTIFSVDIPWIQDP